MAKTGKIVDFFLDKAKTVIGFPRTKVKAVSDDDGVGLDAILDEIGTKADNAMPKTGGTFTGTVYASTTPRQGGNQLRGIWVGNSSWASVDTVEIQMIRK